MSDLEAQRPALEEAFAGLPAGDPAWLSERRKAGFERFQALGFPAPKQEDWKYTPVGKLGEAPFAAAAPGKADATRLEALGFGDFPAHRAVFVDGRFDAALSDLEGLPEGVHLGSLAAALAEDPAWIEAHLDAVSQPGTHAFRALASAFLGDGLFLEVPADTALERPVHAVFLATAEAGASVTYPRLLVVLGRGAKATLVESWHGPDGVRYLRDAVAELVLAESATLEHVKDQREGADAFHLASVQARQAAGSTWRHRAVNLGGRLVRNEVGTTLEAEEASVLLEGLNATRGEQHLENLTSIDHAAARCVSRETYKSILEDRSTGVFRGRVLVRQDSQQTDSEQQNKNLLLSRDATINTKPEMEIYADDVKAAHGATIGQLDPDQIFFLRSRGIGEADARRILVQAFARDLLNRVPVEAVRDGLKLVFSDRFTVG